MKTWTSAVSHFEEKAERFDPERYGNGPAEVLVTLLVRLEQYVEAIRVFRRYLMSFAPEDLSCPSLLHLCQMAGDFEQLKQVAKEQLGPVELHGSSCTEKGRRKKEEGRRNNCSPKRLTPLRRRRLQPSPTGQRNLPRCGCTGADPRRPLSRQSTNPPHACRALCGYAPTAAYTRPYARATAASTGKGSNVASARCNRSWRRARSAGSAVACGPAASSAIVIADTATSKGRSPASICSRSMTTEVSMSPRG